MSLSDKYVEFAEALSELTTLENNIHNKRRFVEDIKKELKSDESDKSIGLEFTGHAFLQISERLEEIALRYSTIYNDVFRVDSPSESLLVPSNMKSFIITLLSNAHKKEQFKEEQSRSNKNTNGVEFRYTININKWSDDKSLQFIAVVEDNYIKTGFFNWV